MKCPYCGDGETLVMDSRPTVDHVKRRRKCLLCGVRFNTIEIDQDMFDRQVKEEGRKNDKNREC